MLKFTNQESTVCPSSHLLRENYHIQSKENKSINPRVLWYIHLYMCIFKEKLSDTKHYNKLVLSGSIKQDAYTPPITSHHILLLLQSSIFLTKILIWGNTNSLLGLLLAPNTCLEHSWHSNIHWMDDQAGSGQLQYLFCLLNGASLG